MRKIKKKTFYMTLESPVAYILTESWDLQNVGRYCV